MSRQVLDEHVDIEWYQQLKQRRAFNKVGNGFGQKGLQDEEILRELHGSGETFHTQDQDYYRRQYCHSSYCIVYYDVDGSQLVASILRFLRHKDFNTHAKRLGKVIKVSLQHIEYYQVRQPGKVQVSW